MIHRILLILTMFFVTCSSFGSGISGADVNFAQINKLIADRKFTEAIPLLKDIIAKEPANADANFKLGLCYYFSGDKRNLSLDFFRKAVRNVNSKYSFNNSVGVTAPTESLFFLGEAFLHNSLPDSAFYYYVKYKNKVKEESPFNLDARLNWCANAIREMSSPLNVNIDNLGNNINSGYFEMHPVVTLDNSVIFFSSTRPMAGPGEAAISDSSLAALDEDIYFAIKLPSGKWSKPVYFQYNTPGNEFPAAVSADGRLLIISQENDGNNDLYFSTFENGEWKKPQSMGPSINSSGNETEASLTKDGNIIYFCSDRKGGVGKFDIYSSFKLPNGKWSQPVNPGKAINTAENEISPYIHPEGQVLYFSSDGYIEDLMGGFDVFYSSRNNDNTWGRPVHMKYPVNTTRDDYNYQIASGGARYYTSLTDFNSYDIVEISGRQDDMADFSFGQQTTGLFSELSVMEVMEIQKEVEKEVQVTDVLEVKTEVEKEVAVVETVEVDKPDDPKSYSLESVDLEAIDSTQREMLIMKVKDYYSKLIGTENSVIFKTVYFSFNSAELLILSKNELRVLVEYLNENPGIKVEVIGHTDITGNWDVNLNVSRERAGSVYRFLLENKIAHNRIIYYGKGSAAPIASNNTTEGRSRNRRVEIMLLK